MAVLQCPNCGSTDLVDEKKKSKGVGGGIGAVLGDVALGPIGLAAGAFLGSKIGNNNEILYDANGNQYHYYHCRNCQQGMVICPSCNNLLALDMQYIRYGSLPRKAGYTVNKGRKCAFCQNVFYPPMYKDSKGNLYLE